MKYATLVAGIISLVLGAIELLFIREGILVLVLIVAITVSGGFAVLLGYRSWRKRESEGLMAIILGNVGLWEIAVWLIWWLNSYEYAR